MKFVVYREKMTKHVIFKYSQQSKMSILALEA